MTCPNAEMLSRLLEEALSADTAAMVQSHLEGCPHCQAALQTLVAGQQSWADASRLLKGKTEEATLPPELEKVVRDLAGNGNETIGETRGGNDEEWLFLTPSATPGHLGRLKQYEVMQIIGRGGMGVVLKAMDENLRRIVAIKMLSPQLAASASARRRFEREAQAAAAVCHENVVTIHAVEVEQGHPYLVMQFVSGVTLQERIDRKGALEVKEILRIGSQICAGLAAAHKQGLVHRDIKPANILLENGIQRVKISDFGLARMLDDASVTQSGVIAGTPMFMSPEQAAGEAVDPRADLFSLGSVLYTMCTGHPPFRAGTLHGVIKRVIEDTPRPIREINPEIPDWLCAIINRLMAKKPQDRFASAAELGELLTRHLAHLQDPLHIAAPKMLAAPSPTRFDEAPHRRLTPKRLAVVILAIVAVTLGLLWWRLASPSLATITVRNDEPDIVIDIKGETIEVRSAAGDVQLPPGNVLIQAAHHGKTVHKERFTLEAGEHREYRLPASVLETVARYRDRKGKEEDSKELPPGQEKPSPLGPGVYGARGQLVELVLDSTGRFALVRDRRQTMTGTYQIKGTEITFVDEKKPVKTEGIGRYSWTGVGQEYSFRKVEEHNGLRESMLASTVFLFLPQNPDHYFRDPLENVMVFHDLPEEVKTWMDKEKVLVRQDEAAIGKLRRLTIHDIAYGHQLLEARLTPGPSPVRKNGSRFATSYYHRGSPLGVVLEQFNWSEKPWHWKSDEFHADARLPAALVGLALSDGLSVPMAPALHTWSEPPLAVVGVLGAGTIAAYGRLYQFIDFYEPSPALIYLSQADGGSEPTFTFITEAQKRGVNVRLFQGPVRKTLQEKAPEEFYRCIIVEPGRTNERPATNLLSLEAVQIFGRKCHEEGFICVHASNRHIELDKVVAAVGTKLGWSCAGGRTESTPEVLSALLYSSNWVILTRSTERLARILHEPVHHLYMGDHVETISESALMKRFQPGFRWKAEFWTRLAPKTAVLTDYQPEILEDYRYDRREKGSGKSKGKSTPSATFP